MTLIVECPINSLSFGNVSINILREFYKQKLDVALFPIGDKIDASAFDIDKDFAEWLKHSFGERWSKYSQDLQSLKIWHLQGAESRISRNQNLLTFHECSEPTERECIIAKNQNKIMFSSNYSADNFYSKGVRSSVVPMGFDSVSFHKDGNVPKVDGVQFGLMGKFEHRKNTKKIIQTWLKKFGNQKGYSLNLCVTNPFFSSEDMQKIFNDTFEGKHYSNVNILPYFETNKEVNQFMNFIDIDLTGLSGGEGWNLPSFNMTCLGKWSIVLDATSHKDWATEENSFLIDPSGTYSCEDGVFFKNGNEYNQGHFYSWDEDEVIAAIEKSLSFVGKNNTEGEKMAQLFTWERTASRILKLIEIGT